jgi:aminoglycoside phosphotransferase (APT) family kinase protein
MDFDTKFDKKPVNDFAPEKVWQTVFDIAVLPRPKSIEPLFGGYSHINYRLKTVEGDFVLRISQKPEREFDSEIAILRALEDKVPVPRVLWTKKFADCFNGHIAILHFIQGSLLCDVEDSLEACQIARIGSQLGQILALFHNIHFDKPGFLGASFSVTEPFDSFTNGYFGHMLTCLNNYRVAERLDSSILSRLKNYTKCNSAIVKSLKRTRHLTHSDFNQKNILVGQFEGEWNVTAILDWEFAYSGAPLGDFGNFFRYPEMSPHYKDALVSAYLENGGLLSNSWEKEARFLDILPMLQFLCRDDELPNTFNTARSVLENTLALDS